MGLNCKVGDVAFVIPPYEDKKMLGLPVNVIRAAALSEEAVAKSGERSSNFGGFGWLCDGHSPHLPCIIWDGCLLPIPPLEEKDEALTSNPVRHEVTA